MHIPAYYKRKSVQYFFVGVIIGAILAYLFFLYINGELTERWIEQNVQLRSKIAELEDQMNGLLQDKENLSKENEEKLSVKEVNIEISNKEQLKLDSMEVIELTTLMKKELSSLIGKNVESIIENANLVESTLENKSFTLSSFSYQPKIQKLFISSKINITVKLNITN